MKRRHPLASYIEARNATILFAQALVQEGMPKDHPIIIKLLTLVRGMDLFFEQLTGRALK